MTNSDEEPTSDDFDDDDDEAVLDILAMGEETLAFLYQLRKDEPDAVLDGLSVDQHIARFEEMIDRTRFAQLDYEATKRELIEHIAKALMQQHSMPSPFWSYAATVGRSYPPHPAVVAYFDVDDLEEYLTRRGINPTHRNN